MRITVKKHFALLMANAILCATFGQGSLILHGRISDSLSGEPLIGASIMVDDQSGTITDPDGHYTLRVKGEPVNLRCQYVGYSAKVRTIHAEGRDSVMLDILMVRSPTMLDEVVISASKYEQRLSDVMVTLEIIKPERIANTSTTSLETIIRQTPGVEILEGQPSIRGGSGYSYGAGSRVMVLMNDMPILSGDAGDVKWDYLPVENISRIEIIKGASSVMYGSSALNGVINIRTAYPLSEPKTSVNIYSGLYMNPQRKEMIWWDRQPLFGGADFTHSRRIRNLDLVVGGNIFADEGYREHENQKRVRVNVGLNHRNSRVRGLSYGFNLTGMYIDKTDFLIWKDSRSGAYRQNPDAISALTGNRFNIDPFINFHGNMGGHHSLKTRLFHIKNDFPEASDKNNRSDNFFGEYRYHRKFGLKHDLSAGISGTYTQTFAQLYGDHTSFNQAGFMQWDSRLLRKLNLTLGVRFERYVLDRETEYSDPVFRTGLNYQLAENSYLRASFGQGYRFPSVAEKYTATNVGTLNVFPNPDLRSETGWSTELGFKQGLQIGEWYGYLDLAVFWTEYQDMIEFNFGVYGKPDSVDVPTNDHYGFKALNVGNTRIAGMELTLMGEGKFGSIPISLMAGYTYMDPINLSPPDPAGPEENQYLKYRYRHSFKADAELLYRRFIFGMSMILNSRMENIDEVFLDPVYGNLILPGFPDYWAENNKGYLHMDARLIYKITDKMKVGLIVKNLLNKEYMGRPGDIQAPRNITVRFSYSF